MQGVILKYIVIGGIDVLASLITSGALSYFCM